MKHVVFSIVLCLFTIKVEAQRLRLAGRVERQPSFDVKLDRNGRIEVVGDRSYFRYEVVDFKSTVRSPASSREDQVLVRIVAP